jgi:hypothetical protein
MVVFAFPESTFLFLGFALQRRLAPRLCCVTPKAAQSRVCLGRRPDGDRRAIVDFLNRGVSVAVDRGARGLDGETE